MLRSRPFRTLARTLTSRGTAPGFVNIARPCDASDITVRKVYIASCKLSAPNHGRITNFVTTEYANVCNAHVVVAHVSPQGSVHSQMACLCDVPSNGIGKYGVLRHLRKQFKSTHNRRVLFEAKRATNLADLSSLQRLFSGVVGGGALDPHGFSYHRELHVVDFIILRLFVGTVVGIQGRFLGGNRVDPVGSGLARKSIMNLSFRRKFLYPPPTPRGGAH